jgi:hypothetical protein
MKQARYSIQLEGNKLEEESEVNGGVGRRYEGVSRDDKRWPLFVFLEPASEWQLARQPRHVTPPPSLRLWRCGWQRGEPGFFFSGQTFVGLGSSFHIDCDLVQLRAILERKDIKEVSPALFAWIIQFERQLEDVYQANRNHVGAPLSSLPPPGVETHPRPSRPITAPHRISSAMLQQSAAASPGGSRAGRR